MFVVFMFGFQTDIVNRERRLKLSIYNNSKKIIV